MAWYRTFKGRIGCAGSPFISHVYPLYCRDFHYPPWLSFPFIAIHHSLHPITPTCLSIVHVGKQLLIDKFEWIVAGRGYFGQGEDCKASSAAKRFDGQGNLRSYFVLWDF